MVDCETDYWDGRLWDRLLRWDGRLWDRYWMKWDDMVDCETDNRDISFYILFFNQFTINQSTNQINHKKLVYFSLLVEFYVLF